MTHTTTTNPDVWPETFHFRDDAEDDFTLSHTQWTSPNGETYGQQVFIVLKDGRWAIDTIMEYGIDADGEDVVPDGKEIVSLFPTYESRDLAYRTVRAVDATSVRGCDYRTLTL